MSFVWKRLQRVNKRAVKYRVLFELRELTVEGCSKWQPNKLVVVFTRRSRRRTSQPMIWEPSIRNPYLGSVQWNLPEIIDIEVTLFKDSHNRYEPKEWTLSVEDVSQMGKPRRIGSMAINISDYVDEQFAVPSRHEFLKMKLNITSKKVKKSFITFMMSTQFLKEGKATDDDMQSLASLISMNGPDPVPDLEDDEPFEYSDQATNQISEMVEQFNQFLKNDDDVDGGEHQKSQLKQPEEEETDQTNQINETNNIKYNETLAFLTNESNNQQSNERQQHMTDTTEPASFSRSSSNNVVECNFESNDDQHCHSASQLHHHRSSLDYSVTASNHHSGSERDLVNQQQQQQHSNEHLDRLKTTTTIYNNNQSNKDPHKTTTSDDNDDGGQHQPSDYLDDSSLNYGNMSINGASSSLEKLEEKFDESAHSINSYQNKIDMETAFSGDHRVDGADSSMKAQYSAQEDLLTWCQEVTKDYSGLRITNMTTSWRNGIAFGAIIHHFRPDLIDFDSLQPSDIVGNCKKVFDVATSLGIPKLIDPNDMIRLNVPDKLSVMTYLYQMRSFFTGKTILNSNLSSTSSLYSNTYDEERESDQTTHTQDIKTKCLDLFNKFDELDKMYNSALINSIENGATQTTEQFTQNNLKTDNKSKKHSTRKSSKRQQQQLMTRKQLLYPFDSDSDEEIEFCKKQDDSKKQAVSRSSSTESENKTPTSPKEPIRKPLQYNKKNNVHSNNIPSSQSTSSFKHYRFNNDEQTSPTITTNQSSDQFQVVAPGLIDLSSTNHSLQRTYSAPNCQNHSIELRKRQREEELRERARKLIESVRMDSNAAYHHTSDRKLSQQEEERMLMLRERARKLIAEAKQGFMNSNTFTSLDSSLDSHSNTTSNSTNATPQILSPSESLSNNLSTVNNEHSTSTDQIESQQQPTNNFKTVEFNFYKFKTSEGLKMENETKPTSKHTETNNKPNKERLQSPTANHDNKSSNLKTSTHSNNTTNKNNKINYNDLPDSVESLQDELNSIEKEQKKIDYEASILEKRLRKLMETGGNKRLEEKLLQNWFVLVNKRNAIIRRQMQLNILEKEADMNRRYEELNAELRNLMLIEDLQKTDEQRTREKELLDELVKIVDKRDELVRHLDNQEKAIEEDEFVESQTQRPMPMLADDATDKNCSIQ